jgi:PAS domain S-box-containing protein
MPHWQALSGRRERRGNGNRSVRSQFGPNSGSLRLCSNATALTLLDICGGAVQPPLFFENGEVMGAVNCFQDISCRKHAEEMIKENERRSRDLLEALPTAIYTTDTEGRITFYNQAAVDLWGCRPELGTATFCGSWRLHQLDGSPMPHDQCPMALALQEGRPIRGAEAVAERPDGTRVIFQPYPTPLHDGSDRPIGAVNMLVDITERKATEEQLRLLASEVDHRAKNMLAVIQAVVNLTQADTISDFKLAVNGRISALARAHTLLSKSRWEGADLRQIVEEELAPFLNGEDVRVSIDGPSLPIAQPLAHCLAMVIHELTTNAVKHGAIRQPTGSIELKWWGSLGDRLLFRWTETGCAQVQPPKRQGFGMSIINGAIRQQLAGEVALEWRSDGLRCEIDVPLS